MRDSIDVWHSRIVKFVRAGGFCLDAARSVLVVFGAALAGAVAGGMVAAKFPMPWPGGFWLAMIAGAALSGMAGWKVARRVFLGDRAEPNAAVETSGRGEALFAPHLPGVQEQFARARKREFALFVVVVASGLFLAYLYKAQPDWPVPGKLSRGQLTWATLAVFAASFVLLVVNARCPACRRRTGGLMGLRRCPVCGIALRD
ncbi:MAG: hypothetical protein ACE15B_13845 [Bryobacteraceae bacterium]